MHAQAIWSVLSVFPVGVHMHHPSHACYTLHPHHPLHLFVLIMLLKYCKLQNFSLCSFLQASDTSHTRKCKYSN